MSPSLKLPLQILCNGVVFRCRFSFISWYYKETYHWFYRVKSLRSCRCSPLVMEYKVHYSTSSHHISFKIQIFHLYLEIKSNCFPSGFWAKILYIFLIFSTASYLLLPLKITLFIQWAGIAQSVNGLWARRSGNWGSITRRRDFSLFHSIQMDWGPPNICCALSPRVKQPECEADRSFPSSSEAKGAWSYTFIPLYNFILWYLINYRYTLPYLTCLYKIITLLRFSSTNEQTGRCDAVYGSPSSSSPFPESLMIFPEYEGSRFLQNVGTCLPNMWHHIPEDIVPAMRTSNPRR
jgi:hypothetical protein